MEKFIEEYEKLKIIYPQLYVSINEARKGNFWRIKVFAYDMAIIGDAELLSVEDESKENAFAKARERLLSIPGQMFRARQIKESKREVFVKR